MQSKLKNELKARGWTTERLAAELQGNGADVANVTVESWLSGKRVPGYRNACILAKVLGWDRNEIFAAAGVEPKAA